MLIFIRPILLHYTSIFLSFLVCLLAFNLWIELGHSSYWKKKWRPFCSQIAREIALFHSPNNPKSITFQFIFPSFWSYRYAAMVIFWAWVVFDFWTDYAFTMVSQFARKFSNNWAVFATLSSAASSLNSPGASSRWLKEKSKKAI